MCRNTYTSISSTFQRRNGWASYQLLRNVKLTTFFSIIQQIKFKRPQSTVQLFFPWMKQNAIFIRQSLGPSSKQVETAHKSSCRTLTELLQLDLSFHSFPFIHLVICYSSCLLMMVFSSTFLCFLHMFMFPLFIMKGKKGVIPCNETIRCVWEKPKTMQCFRKWIKTDSINIKNTQLPKEGHKLITYLIVHCRNHKNHSRKNNHFNIPL